MKRSLSVCLAILCICILPSCGGSGGSSGGSGGGGGSNTPAITSISPSTVTGGGPAFTLTVNGKNFSNATTVQLTLNGTAESGVTTTFISATKLTAAVPASAIASTGTISVELLQNGQPVPSNGVNLVVQPNDQIPQPHITSVSPNTVVAGGPAFTLTVNGTNLCSPLVFVPGVVATGQGSSLVATVPAAVIAYPEVISVSDICTDGLNQKTSNFVNFTVTPAPPGVFQSVSVAAGGATPNGDSSHPAISDNGRFITFASQATNLVTPVTSFPDVYVRDNCIGAPLVDNNHQPLTCTPSTLLVSAEPAGDAASPVEGNGPSTTPSVGNQEFGSTATGAQAVEYFGFLSAATNLVVPSTTHQQAYFRDTCYFAGVISGCTPTTVLASANQSGGEPNAAATDYVMASQLCNGAFVSAATDVVAGVTIPNEIYFSDCAGGSPHTFTASTVISVSGSGTPGNQGGLQPAVDSDGNFIAFASTSTNLTSTPIGGFQQVYLRAACAIPGSTCTPATTIVSVDGSGNALPGNSENPAISQDARFVTFTTQVPQSGGGTFDTVYRYDSCVSDETAVPNCTPSVATISVGAGGAANGSSDSGRHALSIDGRYVAFDSQATNLISGGNPAGQVFVRDTCSTSEYGSTGTVPGCTPSTNMVSVNSGVAIGGSQEAISADGHFVVFVTTINGIQQVVLAYTGF